MLVYLVQHAEAKPESEDPTRGLSEKGLKDISKVADFLKKLNIQVDQIFHSGKLRAKQTAEILANALRINSSETQGLAPLDDPYIWADRIRVANRPIMLVGHLPHLSYLTSILICGNKDRSVVSFKMGGVVCLEGESDTWSVKWMIIPEIIL